MSTTAIISAAGIVVAALLSYLAAARRLSGKIQTSEAADLWEEAARLRKEYKLEVDDLREIVSKLRERLADIEARNDNLYAENKKLKAHIEVLEAENVTLKERNAELEALNG